LGYNLEGRTILGRSEMRASGTVKSFNYTKGYGFIRTDFGKDEIFVHLSAVQKAGLASLRKGQKISFDIFDNQGRPAAKNLSADADIATAAGPATEEQSELVVAQTEMSQDARCSMSLKKIDNAKVKRTPITRAALELAITETIRANDSQCQGLVGVIVERVVPKLPGDANWAVKGIKYGKADRDRCSAALSDCVKQGQQEFEVTD
jgi:CspA family cold shock protein